MRYSAVESISEFRSTIHLDLIHFAYKNLKPKFYEMNNTMSKKANFALVDKYSFFCDDIKKECKLYNSNKEPLFYDELHLTVKGYNIFGLELINFLCKRDNKYCD